MSSKGMGLALAVLIVSSAATAAATEGPFWKVSGARLAAGETRLLLASAKEKFLIESKGVGITFACQGLKFPVGSAMQIVGQVPRNSGTGDEVIEFTTCTVTGNGSPCEVENGRITTILLLSLLGYGSASRTGQVLVLFEPAPMNFSGAITLPAAGSKSTKTWPVLEALP